MDSMYSNFEQCGMEGKLRGIAWGKISVKGCYVEGVGA